MSDRTKHFNEHFKNFVITSTKEINSELIIEGWANPIVVDRGNEIMPQNCWQLENYAKTGIILFNHKKDKPIGKCIEIKATPEGLYIKARISKSKNKFVSYIRDLIRERILNAFSVGFRQLDQYATPEGITVITEADLFEVSVVSVPMNQDAIFTISSKQLEAMSYQTAVEKVLQFKGADEALEIRAKAQKAGFTTEEIVQRLTNQFKMRRQEAWDLMSGNKALDDEQKKAISDIVAAKKGKKKPEEGEEAPPVADPAAVVDPKAKPALNKPLKEGEKPLDPNAKPGDKPEEKIGEETEEKPALPTDEEGMAGQADLLSPEAKHTPPAPAVHAILVPLSTAETMEEAVAIAGSYGFTPMEEPIEDADGWIINVRPEEDFMGELATMTIGDGVLALIGVLVPEHKEVNATGEAGPGEEGSEAEAGKGDVQDDPANAGEENEEDGESTDDNAPVLDPLSKVHADTDDQLLEGEEGDADTKPAEEGKKKPKKTVKHFYSEVEAVESGTDASYRPDWATDKPRWEKAKAASLASLGKVSYAFLVTQYIKLKTAEGTEDRASSVKTKSGAIREMTGEELDSNPIQEGSKQTHILLGALIAEIQGLRGDLREQTVALAPARPSAVPEPVQTILVDKTECEEEDKVHGDYMKSLHEQLERKTAKIKESMKMLGLA